ncbi:septum site-determining protein Ssd [Kineococcus sp. SYSU DK001]|uniref:septum site-determining protein Ssd n=1 Tax=Kineococcus sp. SYSU DK001 TaxID=3383122 RepID=UPI003D7E8463
MPVRPPLRTSRRRPATTPLSRPGTVRLLTDDPELTAAVSRLAAAAGCPLRRDGDPAVDPAVDPADDDPDEGAPAVALVVAGVDADPAALSRARAGGTPAVVVGHAPLPGGWWQEAAALDPDHAVVLPEAQDWLLERLSDVADGVGGRGPVLGVVGGTGGAGASVLAAALARALADTVGGCLLVDGDPRSGGLDLLVGGDALPGLRWADLAGVQGRLAPQVLRSAVDVGGGLHVLPCDRDGGGGPDPAQVWTVVDAARRAFPATVVDLPRGGLDGFAPVLGACAELLVVTPGTTRGAAAACVVLDELRAAGVGEVRLVVRDVGAGADPDDVADAAGAALAGVVRPDRDLDAALELGEGVPGGRRSGLRAFAMACARDWAAGA